MEPAKQPISFVGLGSMGFGMATHLIREGYSVTGFDMYAPILERFRKAGGEVANSLADAVIDKPHCILMVANAQQAQAALFGDANLVVKSLPQGAVIYICSTVSSTYVQTLEKSLLAVGRGDLALIDCPVSGGPVKAANGTLSIMVGGSETAIAKGSQVLQALANPEKLNMTRRGIGTGSQMKMVHQVLAATQILAMSESMGFARLLGLDMAVAAAAIAKSKGWSWVFDDRLQRILDVSEPLSSALTIITKDAGIITSEARRAGFSCPMTAATEQVFFAAIARGYGADDDSGVIRLYLDRDTTASSPCLVEGDDAKLALVINLLRGIHLCSTAECLAFAHQLGLDLDQVFQICANASGESAMFRTAGPDIVKILHAGHAADSEDGQHLQATADGLQQAVQEAQNLRFPLFLGSQALNLITTALHSSDRASKSAEASVVSAWSPKVSCSENRPSPDYPS